jgi:hypothetical protein
MPARVASMAASTVTTLRSIEDIENEPPLLLQVDDHLTLAEISCEIEGGKTYGIFKVLVDGREIMADGETVTTRLPYGDWAAAGKREEHRLELICSEERKQELTDLIRQSVNRFLESRHAEPIPALP